MTTSLSKQLQRLAVPQTAHLVDSRKRASILFDAKEAATKDRRTIYELGLNGLQELIAINPKFKQFESTLFDEFSLNVERAVENVETNKLLNRNIKKFLQHLSPYFLLRPAHLCLEWLLRRFQIHNYNRSDLMSLALPYHETNIFVRVMQTINFNNMPDDMWDWLKPLQKPGLPLPKSAIINRAASHSAFFKFVCSSTLAALKELGAEAGQLQVQISFYTSVIVGAFEVAPSILEWHIIDVLESLNYCIQSSVLDVCSAGYVIAAQLVSRAQLKAKLSNILVERISAVTFNQLLPTAILTIILVFERQTTSPPSLTEKSFTHLMKQKWLISVLADLCKENIDIFPLCEAFIRYAIQIIENEEAESTECRKLLNQLLSQIEMPQNIARKFISCFLDSYKIAKEEKKKVSSLRHGDVIELDESDDNENGDGDGDVPMESGKMKFQSWYSEYLRGLERKYPTAFDAIIKETLGSKNQSNANRNAAIKMALSFRLKFSNENHSEIYESLYHYTSKMRLAAVQTLISNLNDYQNRVQNYELLKVCLADRLMDDSVSVQAELLKLPTKDFINILGYDQFANFIIEILFRLRQSQTISRKEEQLEQQLVQHLASQAVIENYDVNIILMAFMPLLFPNTKQDQVTSINTQAVASILQSPLNEKVPFIKNLRKTLMKSGKIERAISTSEMRRIFLETITSSEQVFRITDLFDSIEQRGGDKYFKQPMQLTNLLILANASCHQELKPTECWNILQKLQNYSKLFKISANVDWSEVIPLQLFTDFLLSLMRYTKFDVDSVVSWKELEITEKQEESKETQMGLRCVLNVFSLLASNTFSPTQKNDEVLNWTMALKEFFNEVFGKAQTKCDFLLNFYVNSESKYVENYIVHRLYAYKIFNNILMNPTNEVSFNMEHILKISIGLIDDSQTLRAACLETLQLISERENLEKSLKIFIDCILARKTEITMDEQQYPLALFKILTSKTKDTKTQLMVTKVFKGISGMLMKPDVALRSPTLTLQILRITTHLNDIEMLLQLIPVAIKSLEFTTNSILEDPYSEIFQLSCKRFVAENVASCFKRSPNTWQLFEKIFDNFNTFVIDSEEMKMLPLPCIAMEIVHQCLYDNLPEAYKTKYVQLILKAIANSDNNTILLCANKLLKKSEINCEPLTQIITEMFKDDESYKPKSPKSAGNRMSKSPSISWNSKINSICWKQGIALLELLEDKKHLLNLEKMLVPLFDLLAFCLLDAEANASVEYTKQMTLSVLLNCCQYFKANAANVEVKKTLAKSPFHIDRIVQTLRASPNPQTHRRALLLLTYCADLFPQQVLHNIVDIFTFMGSSVVRQDDAYSFHIIDSIIQSIVPILVQQTPVQQTRKKSSESDINRTVVPVLKVFSDIILDVPEHRRLNLYTKLMKTLGAEKYYWMFLCILFESHVMNDEKQKLAQKKAKKGEKITAPEASRGNRLEVALTLMDAFDPKTTLETCIQLLSYLESLPTTKQDNDPHKKSTRNLTESPETALFDVKNHTAKQLRHYKYVIMQFLSSASSSTEFLRKLAILSDEEHQAFKPHFENFITHILSFFPIVNSAIDQAPDEVERKYWKIISNYVQDTLDNAMALLSPEIFIHVVNGLLRHEMFSIRRKVIELLSVRIQKEGPEIYKTCSDKTFKTLIQSLGEIIDSIFEDSTACNHEKIVLQQSALIAVKHLSKYFALKHVEEFKALLKTVTKISKDSLNISKILLASVVLAIVEVACNLKAHSLAQLPKFMPRLIHVLQQQVKAVKRQPPDHVCIAIITGMQKLFVSLPLFLGPHIVDILTAFSSMAAHIHNQSNEKHQNSIVALQKIDDIWKRIATSVPLRILVPSCEKSYRELMAAERYKDISILMNLLKGALKHAENADLNSEQTELHNFCLHALEFRLVMQDKNANVEQKEISEIETSILEAFVAWVLKLSESVFRPLYEGVYEWAFKTNPCKSTQITFFIFSEKISHELKTIFALFSGIFLEDAAQLLKECKIVATDENSQEDRMEVESEHLDIELVRSILRVFHNIFLHAGKNFVSLRRFDLLMQPIVDQMENRWILEDESMQSTLIDCISQFAVAVSTDIMWKQLNYQVLMKTRTNVPEVRILAMNAFVEVARKLGEEFATLLPETVPFIAELFEDENSRVEKNTRKAVQELESILGESLQKYL